MYRQKRVILLFVFCIVALLVFFLYAGCTTAPSPEETPTPSPTATSTPTPTPGSSPAPQAYLLF
ncbi:MAG: hypothetical protein HPY68_05760 [Candidatus Atribacteria bacterium]|nr:hypothetical protein [Candidatus Atribacteria bacterium]